MQSSPCSRAYVCPIADGPGADPSVWRGSLPPRGLCPGASAPETGVVTSRPCPEPSSAVLPTVLPAPLQLGCHVVETGPGSPGQLTLAVCHCILPCARVVPGPRFPVSSLSDVHSLSLGLDIHRVSRVWFLVFRCGSAEGGEDPADRRCSEPVHLPSPGEHPAPAWVRLQGPVHRHPRGWAARRTTQGLVDCRHLGL